jgi:hypothetical protein
MAISPVAPIPGGIRKRIFGKVSLIMLLALVLLLSLCLIFSRITRDAMAHLPFLSGQGQAHSLVDSRKTLVDQHPWQTAQALAPLAVTAEETECAHEAERLADHEVDQAFASALRLASTQAQHRVLTGEALALSLEVAQLQQLVKGDQSLVQKLTPASGARPARRRMPRNRLPATTILKLPRRNWGSIPTNWPMHSRILIAHRAMTATRSKANLPRMKP